MPIEEARGNASGGKWAETPPAEPKQTSLHVSDDISMQEIVDYIDWTPFFITWEMKGMFPGILDDPQKGETARELYGAATRMLDRIVSEKWFTPRGVLGLWPANSEGDDWDTMLIQSLADRMAEALAEAMHARVRRELWGCETEELVNEDLIAERYRGIRLAPGYPACPDHSEKRILFDLLQAEERTGLHLTESCAMWPAAAVSGFYLAHPEAAYFGVGRIGCDQVEDYAARKGIPLDEAEMWLAPNLAYTPGQPGPGDLRKSA